MNSHKCINARLTELGDSFHALKGDFYVYKPAFMMDKKHCIGTGCFHPITVTVNPKKINKQVFGVT